jgi:hypothetical protein
MLLGIGGIPGSGKSHAIRQVLKATGPGQLVRQPGVPTHHVLRKGSIIILGDYSDEKAAFPGTDRLSFSVQPSAESFISSAVKSGAVVVFEGDRLFNSRTIEFAKAKRLPHRFLVLQVPAGCRTRQAALRGHPQSATFLKRCTTKLAHISQRHPGVQIVTQQQLARVLRDLINTRTSPRQPRAK